MCLNNNPAVVARTLAKPRKKTYLICYKVLQINLSEELVAPYRGTPYVAGVVKAEPYAKYIGGNIGHKNGFKVNTRRRHKEEYISYGIHVCTSFQEAERLACRGEFRVIVPVKCELKHLMGMNGRGQAVFTQITLSEQHYKSAVATGVARRNSGAWQDIYYSRKQYMK